MLQLKTGTLEYEVADHNERHLFFPRKEQRLEISAQAHRFEKERFGRDDPVPELNAVLGSALLSLFSYPSQECWIGYCTAPFEV